MQNKYNKFLLIGALTSKPYSFKSRAWELENIRTIDLFDSLCSNIKIDIKGTNIMRISPINNKQINDYWISDKTRYAYDGLKKKRFINPMKRQRGLLIECSWKQIQIQFQKLFSLNIIGYENFVIKTGFYTDLEHLTTLQTFVCKLTGWMNIVINNEDFKNNDLRENYLLCQNDLFTSSSSYNVLFFLNVNFQDNNPILNLQLNKLIKQENILAISINTQSKINFNCYNFNSPKYLDLILKGKHPLCNVIANFLKKNIKNKKIDKHFWNNCLFFYTSTDYNNQNKILKKIQYFNEVQKILKLKINTFTPFSGLINLAELGFSNNNKITEKSRSIFYLLNCEKIKNIRNRDFVIFQGHHNLKMYKKFDLILPNTTWVEKNSLYFNCFGLLQKTQFSSLPPMNSKNDWKITKLLTNNIAWFARFLTSKKIPFVNYIEWYNNKKKIFFNEWLEKRNIFENSLYINFNTLLPSKLKFLNSQPKKINLNFKNKNYKVHTTKDKMPLKLNVHNYYLISSIENASIIMQNCSSSINSKNNNFRKYN